MDTTPTPQGRTPATKEGPLYVVVRQKDGAPIYLTAGERLWTGDILDAGLFAADHWHDPKDPELLLAAPLLDAARGEAQLRANRLEVRLHLARLGVLSAKTL